MCKMKVWSLWGSFLMIFALECKLSTAVPPNSKNILGAEQLRRSGSELPLDLKFRANPFPFVTPFLPAGKDDFN
jgi:hypothetical protein